MQDQDGKEKKNSSEGGEEILLTFWDKEGFPFCRRAIDVLLATPKGRHCMLVFENKEELEWNKSLKKFHMLVWPTNLYRRLGRFLVLKITKVKSRKFRMALLKSGMQFGLTRGGNTRLRNYLNKHPKP